MEGVEMMDWKFWRSRIAVDGGRRRSLFLALAAVLAVFAVPVGAQTPDCVSFFTFSNAGTAGAIAAPGIAPNAGGIDNRQTACINWTMVYESTGFASVSLQFQSANGALVPGAWGAFSGTIINGVNPGTNTTINTTTFNGYVGWWRVNLTAVTGTGTLRGALYGYRNGFPPPSTGPPCPGTATVPCVVDGPDAPGAVPTKNPVQVSGFDGTDVRRISTDTTGRTINDPLGAATAQADGQSNTPTVPFANGVAMKVPTYPYAFDGTTWERQFWANNQAVVSISAGTAQTLVAGVALTKTRLTHLDFSSNSGQSLTIVSGTMMTTPCDTGQVVLAGPYQNTLTFVLNWDPWGPLTAAVGQDVCLIFGGSVTTGGVAMYAQF
jgi:hypothetical protein